MKDRAYDRRDLERNEDPETVAGAVSGATGAAMGAGAGMLLGPLGAIAGALAGAAGGWWAGRELHRAVERTDRAEHRMRRAHEHAGATRPWEEVRHGYQLGYLAGQNPAYRERAFEEIEPELRAAWVKAHEQDARPVSWDAVSAYARAAYDMARNE